jgi:hypothetical protein
LSDVDACVVDVRVVGECGVNVCVVDVCVVGECGVGVRVVGECGAGVCGVKVCVEVCDVEICDVGIYGGGITYDGVNGDCGGDVDDEAKAKFPDVGDVILIGENNCTDPLRVTTGAGNKGTSESVEFSREWYKLSASEYTCSITGDCDASDIEIDDVGIIIFSNRGSDLSGTLISLITNKDEQKLDIIKHRLLY